MKFQNYCVGPYNIEDSSLCEESVKSKEPDVLVDLGGDTGFILRELIRRKRIPVSMALSDLDLSERQLQSLSDTTVRPLKGSFMEFTRRLVAPGNERLMLATRSTLHYAG